MSVINDPKMAIVTGATTTASGLNTALGLEWIPDSIGKLATCVGIALSCIMIKYWYQKTTNERKESRLSRKIQETELQLLLQELKEKKQNEKKEPE